MSEQNAPAVDPTESVVNHGTPDAAPAPGSSPDAPPVETMPARPNYQDEAKNDENNKTPFVRPDLEDCPKCTTGLLYVIGYDEDAKHENQQPIYHPQMLSGGSVETQCFVCGHRETFALNPTKAPVNPNPGV